MRGHCISWKRNFTSSYLDLKIRLVNFLTIIHFQIEILKLKELTCFNCGCKPLDLFFTILQSITLMHQKNELIQSILCLRLLLCRKFPCWLQSLCSFKRQAETFKKLSLYINFFFSFSCTLIFDDDDNDAMLVCKMSMISQNHTVFSFIRV